MLREIQEAAVSRENSITDLLRQCKVFAVRSGSREFQEWVDLELNGYSPGSDVPPYRISEVESKGHFLGGFGRQLKNAPIPVGALPEKFQEGMRSVRLTEPIGSYEDLLQSPSESSGTFQVQWPADLIALVGTDIYEGLNCIQAWQVVPRGLVVSLIDAVRNRVLNFALELEQIAPMGGEGGDGSENITAETVTQVFHTHVYGNVGNIASGSRKFSQSANVVAGDIDTLVQKLKSFGFEEGDIEALKKAPHEDQREGKGIGKRVSAWLGKAIAMAGEGILEISTETAARVLPSLIRGYLGLPPAS